MLNAERCTRYHDNIVDVILSFQSHLNYRHHMQHQSNANANTTFCIYRFAVSRARNTEQFKERQLALGTHTVSQWKYFTYFVDFKIE